MKVLSDLDVSGKRVFLRADLDVVAETESAAVGGGREVNHDVGLEGDLRLVSIKPSVDWLLEHGARQIIIAGHMDRPKGLDPKLSTKQLIAPLEKILKRSVIFRENLDLAAPESLVSLSQLLLLENLRFWPGEEKNDPEFAKELAQMADVYVNDAFATSHRDHASMTGVPALVPHAAGLHLEQEIKVLGELLEKPEKPFVVIIGGIKVETKLPVIKKLSEIANHVLIGGYLPVEIGQRGDKFAPNVVVATTTTESKDTSPESVSDFEEFIKGARTIFWNGNLGLTEEGFTQATMAIAKAISESGAKSIVGGGNTVDFLRRNRLLEGFTHISTGGGVVLDFIEGKELPGIVALQ